MPYVNALTTAVSNLVWLGACLPKSPWSKLRFTIFARKKIKCLEIIIFESERHAISLNKCHFQTEEFPQNFLKLSLKISSNCPSKFPQIVPQNFTKIAPQ